MSVRLFFYHVTFKTAVIDKLVSRMSRLKYSYKTSIFIIELK